MFVFNSTCGSNHGNEAISFPDHPFYSHFPSLFDDDVALLLQQHQHFDMLLQQQQQQNESTITRNNINVHEYHQNNLTMDHEQQPQIQRKRGSSKRDRHSKINTLRGPRDRRMRLSLPVARQFFGLQDMLGVDKASKTVEWLLFQARHQIKKLISRDDRQDTRTSTSTSTTPPPSSISDGEVVSGIDETTITSDTTKEGGRKATKKDQTKRSVARKTALFHPLARECRARARARARARTREKQLQIREKTIVSSDHHHHHHSNGPIEQIIEGTKQDQIIDEQLRITRGSQGIIDDHDPDDCLMIMGRWSPSNSIYNSLHNNNNGSPQQPPFGDFQFFGKPWEAYNNNHGIC